MFCLWPAPFLQISNQVISATTCMGSEFFHVELALFVNWTGRVTKKLFFFRIGQPPKYSSSVLPQEGLPRWLSREADSQGRTCRRPEFDLWVGKIPRRGNATHSKILAWEIPRTEEPGGHSPWSRQEETGLSDWAPSRSLVTACSEMFS